MSYFRDLPRQLISIFRYPKLYLFSKRMGRNNRIGPGGRFLHYEEIHLGDNIYIASGFHISARNLKVGNGVLIGPNLLLECDDHVFTTVGKSIWATRHERNLGFVTIEDDVWIGGNVTILKNVIIGEGCIVGAASVVTKILPPYTICIGSPCHPVKGRFTEGELKEHLSVVSSKLNYDAIIETWKKYKII